MMPAVRAEYDGAVGTLVIDHPARRNAMSIDMYASVPTAVATLTADPALRVVILRGEGDVAFGAGSDISEFPARRSGDAATKYNAIEEAAVQAISAISVPVIALIHGPCMGGGAGMALCADIRMAADDATFAVPPARLGIGYPASSTRRLAKTVGTSRAKDLIFSGRAINAEEALRIGMVDAVVPKAELDEYVAAYAARIAKNAPLTIAAAKLVLGDAGPAVCDAAIAACYSSDDYAEGIRAFGDKRRPTFHGR